MITQENTIYISISFLIILIPKEKEKKVNKKGFLFFEQMILFIYFLEKVVVLTLFLN